MQFELFAQAGLQSALDGIPGNVIGALKLSGRKQCFSVGYSRHR